SISCLTAASSAAVASTRGAASCVCAGAEGAPSSVQAEIATRNLKSGIAYSYGRLGPVHAKCATALGFGEAQGKAPGEAACSPARNEPVTKLCAPPKPSPKGDPGKRPPSALLMLAVARATAALRALMAGLCRVTW